MTRLNIYNQERKKENIHLPFSSFKSRKLRKYINSGRSSDFPFRRGLPIFFRFLAELDSGREIPGNTIGSQQRVLSGNLTRFPLYPSCKTGRNQN